MHASRQQATGCRLRHPQLTESDGLSQHNHSNRHVAGRPLAAICIAVLLAAPVPVTWAREATPGVQVQTVATLPDADSTKIEQYTLTNARGTTVTVLTYGATITGVSVADRDGKRENVTLHFDDPAKYLAKHPLFGSLVGRYANRIARARFSIDSVEYTLTANAGENHIHGGQDSFQRLVWSARPVQDKASSGVELTHTSPDGHEGYPGTLQVKVHYRLTNDDRLILEYWATTDKPTHVNLTNHAYWNLKGIRSGNVLDHLMQINAGQCLEATAQRYPTGKILSVTNTPLDFRTPQTIGSRIMQVTGQNYDDCYVIDRPAPGTLTLAARATSPATGRVMEVYTTTPGVQFYTAKGLNGKLGTGDTTYGPYHGFCLETQFFPDSPNQPQFPSTLLRPGATYHQKTIYAFRVEK